MVHKIEAGILGRCMRALLAAGIAAVAGCTEQEVDTDPGEVDEELEWRDFVAPSYPNASLPDDAALPGPGPAPYYRGVAAASESLAVLAAQKVLADGGDAIDAAVVMQAMLNVVEPQSSGLGGGAIWLIYRADLAKTLIIDCRERAPGAATASMFASQSSIDLKSTSGISVGVPGSLHCMDRALALTTGGMTMAEALAPAITTATTGFAISARLASATGSDQLQKEPGNAAYDEARKVFRPGGSALAKGTLLKQPALADTLQKLASAKDPIAAFYDCAHPSGIASAIVSTQKARRASYSAGAGRMACSDLLSYKAVTDSKPLELDYHGYKIVTTPAPTSGVHLLQMLGMLDRFKIGSATFGFGQLNTMTVMQEAMRMAFADRAMWLGDPLFVDVPQSGLLASAYLGSRSKLITAGKRNSNVSAGDPRPFQQQVPQLETPVQKQKKNGKGAHEGADTTHFVTSDQWGNIVSVTSTVSDLWGTGLMVKGHGLLLNDQLLNFNDIPTKKASPFNPGANDVAPFKRPRTTIAPTLVFLKGEPVATQGSPGGTTIINALLGFLINLIDHRMMLQDAVARPRFSLDNPGTATDTEIEPGFSSSVRQSLEQLGYDFDDQSNIGAVQALIVNQFDDRKYGTADPRRTGSVMGIQ